AGARSADVGQLRGAAPGIVRLPLAATSSLDATRDRRRQRADLTQRYSGATAGGTAAAESDGAPNVWAPKLSGSVNCREESANDGLSGDEAPAVAASGPKD